MIVLALDLATVTGWARGVPGGDPAYGSLRIAAKGASHSAVFGKFGEWLIKETAGERRPDQIVYEAPIIAKWGKTNADTNIILQGLPAIVEMVAWMRGIYNTNLQRVHVSKVRSYFIGRERLERKEAKQLTMRKCKLLRWDPQDDNAGDALALWSYRCAQIDYRTSIKVTPLFMHSVKAQQ